VNGDTLNGWVLACLAVMAVSLLAMAAGQVVLAVMAARTARQTMDTLQEFRRDFKPIVEKAQKIADDAARATAIAVVQAERINEVTEMTARKIDETLSVVQDAVSGPLRQGAAVIAGLRAALEVFRSAGERRTARDEDDALFIG
jgi:predicted transcriptional regulator